VGGKGESIRYARRPLIYDFKNGMATRQPVLWTVAHPMPGPIAELGCGYGSTPLLRV